MRSNFKWGVDRPRHQHGGRQWFRFEDRFVQPGWVGVLSYGFAVTSSAMNENVLRAFAGFESIYPYGTIERSILEKVILRVSQLHECQFCTNSHLEIMQGLGID